MGFPITWIIVFLFLESASLGETAIPRANQSLRMFQRHYALATALASI